MDWVKIKYKIDWWNLEYYLLRIEHKKISIVEEIAKLQTVFTSQAHPPTSEVIRMKITHWSENSIKEGSMIIAICKMIQKPSSIMTDHPMLIIARFQYGSRLQFEIEIIRVFFFIWFCEHDFVSLWRLILLLKVKFENTSIISTYKSYNQIALMRIIQLMI